MTKTIRPPKLPAAAIPTPATKRGHLGWSREDVFSVLNLVFAVVGLVFVVVSALPALLPEVAVVTDVRYTHVPGLNTAVTTFQNVSHDQPITAITASWRLNRDGISATTDRIDGGVAIRDSLGTWKILDSSVALPAHAQFQTIFNSPDPFQIEQFRVYALTKVFGPTGELQVQVAHLDRHLYTRLRNAQYLKIMLVLLAFLSLYYLVLRLTKWVLGKA